VVVADRQTAGRGRLGRAWIAPPSSSLLVSLVLRRRIPPIFLTAAYGVAALEAIEQIADIPSRIKWPNDLMIRDRKLAGILTEVVATIDGPAVVVGLGLNANLDPATSGLPPTATSLSHELGRAVDRDCLLYAILERLDVHLAVPDADLPRLIRARWESLLWRRLQRVQVGEDHVVVEGTAVGLALSGALRLRVADGQVREIAVGDVLVS
jgi:BirA family biotin operon repressor/biotin-[acetyl-CoA-carboxylase] ligase